MLARQVHDDRKELSRYNEIKKETSNPLSNNRLPEKNSFLGWYITTIFVNCQTNFKLSIMAVF